MTELAAIWNRARSDLVIPTEQGGQDLYLWEHSSRVTRAAEQIMKLPSVAKLSPDEAAVVAAALYHDSAWALRVRNKEIARYEVLVSSPKPDHHEQSTLLMKRSLADLVSAESLERATAAIESLDHRDIEPVEGQILADAESLDEFGVVSLWAAVRRGAFEGHAVEDFISRWQKKTEYHFWNARLSDAFRFQAVRALAKKRLERLEELMRELKDEQNAGDFGSS